MGRLNQFEVTFTRPKVFRAGQEVKGKRDHRTDRTRQNQQ